MKDVTIFNLQCGTSGRTLPSELAQGGQAYRSFLPFWKGFRA
jgi:hypothetical protein